MLMKEKIPIPKRVTTMLQLHVGDEIGWVEKRKPGVVPCGRITEKTSQYAVVQAADATQITYSRQELMGKITIIKYGCAEHANRVSAYPLPELDEE